MSAPTPAPGDDRPREGFYPDPSIPGYVRYWNGAAWVPGTSRPAPTDGEPLAPPGGSPAVEETGPHFFDEDPDPVAEPGGAATRPSADALHGNRPEPASAWGADRSRQTGFGGDKDRRVSWGSPRPAGQGPDPRVSLAADAGDPAAESGRTASTDGTATIPPADDDTGAPEGTVVFRRPGTGTGAGGGGGAEASRADGTMAFRSKPAVAGPQAAGPQGAGPGPQGAGPQGAGPAAAPGVFGAPLTSAQAAAQQALGLTPQASSAAAPVAPPAPDPALPPAAPFGPQLGPQAAPGPQVPAAPPVVAAPLTPTAPPPRQPEQPAVGGSFAQTPPAAALPQQPTAPRQSADTPMAVGAGGGQPSWAQQVHRLAGGDGEQPVAPWKPVVEDPFQAAARRQAEARPAGLGRRLVARLVDSAIVGSVTAVAAVPFGTRALDHIDGKIDAARLSGERVTVWLIDGTTSVYLGIVLGVLFVVSAVYEVLPTAKWGATLGKRLLGLEVRDIEGHEPPTFGGSLRRWLAHTVPGLLGIGVVGVLWCVIDKPWRQCWHDKAAHTFVAGR
ncbi:RDD family protein [Streptomyces sp. HM190]|uniref:RDD family protein n=1 Tax=Streptomyces sp. HM190 TaxID=2695266 RepID=UPI0013591166|nr:RDD family protein [Streptomyces sp. HM190]